MTYRCWAWSSFVLVIGCSSPEPEDQSVLTAAAGADQRVHWRTTVQLDGSASRDSDGDPITFAWTILQRPTGSAAELGGATTATPTLAPDRVGTYVLSLVVSDDDRPSVAETVAIDATNTRPIARAGSDAVLPAASGAASFDGAASSDPDGDPLTFAWTITSAPAGSTTAPQPRDMAATTLAPTTLGTYQLTLTVSDGETSATDDATVVRHAGAAPIALGYEVIDAEYSNPLDRIVAVSPTPAALHLLDGGTGTSVDIALPSAPTAVSLAPDGRHAAVGHDGAISIVDLATTTVTATWPVPGVVVNDLVYGDNGWVYVLAVGDQWEPITGVMIATGARNATIPQVTERAIGRWHPTRTALYINQVNSSPNHTEWFRVYDSGGLGLWHTSPDHGTNDMCMNMWFTDDGLRMFTACGRVFSSTDSNQTDMTYLDIIPDVGRIVSFDHSGATRELVFVEDHGARTRLHRDTDLTQAASFDTPPVLQGAALVAEAGRFVFWRRDSSAIYTLVRYTVGGAARDSVWSIGR